MKDLVNNIQAWLLLAYALTSGLTGRKIDNGIQKIERLTLAMYKIEKFLVANIYYRSDH